MPEKWMTHRLEFTNFEGTRRFRLDKPTAGCRIILSGASVDDADARFTEIEEESIGLKAIPILALLATHAANGGDGLKNVAIYQIVWWNQDLKAPIKRSSLDASKVAGSIQTEIKIIRRLIGHGTVRRIEDGYCLTAPVQRSPLGGKGSTAEPTTGDAPTPQDSESKNEKLIAALEEISKGTEPRIVGAGLVDQKAPLNSTEVAAATRLTFPPSELAPASQSTVFARFGRFLRGWSAPLARRFHAGTKLSIYVASFGNDKPSLDARERVIASIRRELGPDLVNVLFAPIHLAVADDAGDAAAVGQARSYLQKKRGDLLIYGRLYGTLETKAQMDLRFVSPGSCHTRPQPFGFTEYLLDADFAPELGIALAAIAGSMAIQVAQNSGRFSSELLRPISSRLASLMNDLQKMNPIDRASMFDSYGLVRSIIWEECQDPGCAKDALLFYRAALEDGHVRA